MDAVNQNNRNQRMDRNQRMEFSDTMLPTTSTQMFYLSAVAPSVLVGFFILLSIFNQNLKGLAYLVGVCVLLTITGFVSELVKITKPNDKSCKLVSYNPISFTGLPFGMQIYAFTFFYLLLPMIINNIPNIPLIFTLILLAIIDGVINITQNCSNTQHIFISLIMGCIIGTLWSLAVYSVDPGLIYHTDYITSNKLACQLPSKQNFKCVVKKNGEIIG